MHKSDLQLFIRSGGYAWPGGYRCALMMADGELQLFIRSGGYAWPGGYQCALMMADGECIDAQAARENYRQIRRNMAPNDPYARDWIPHGVFIHWEGEPLICADSGREIPSVYGIPETYED